MKAIILAAGKSSRLYPLTLEKPKCLLEIAPGKTLIDHQIELLKSSGISDITVVVGYLKEKIQQHLRDSVKYLEDNSFMNYNNLHTLYNVKNELNEDTLILFADVLFNKTLLKKLINTQEDFCLLVHNKEILKDTMRVKISQGSITDIGSHIPPEEGHGNFIGISKFSKKACQTWIYEAEKIINNTEHNNDYYTIPLTEISKTQKVGFEYVNNEPWIEIDLLKDYEKAKELYPSIN